MNNTYCQLLNADNPKAGGPTVHFPEFPKVGDSIVHPSISGTVQAREFRCLKGPETSSLHYVALLIVSSS